MVLLTEQVAWDDAVGITGSLLISPPHQPLARHGMAGDVPLPKKSNEIDSLLYLII